MTDYEEIVRPLKLNAWGYDANDMEMLAESMAKDVELVFQWDELIEDPEVLGEGRTVVGRDALVAHMKGTRAAFTERGESPYHVLTNILVERVGDGEADVRCFYQFCVQSASEGLQIRGLSRYFDHLIIEDGAWRIRHRINLVAHQASRRSAPWSPKRA